MTVPAAPVVARPLAALTLLAAMMVAAAAWAQRDPLPKPALEPRPAHPHRLVVKFMDHLRARAAADGTLTTAQTGSARATALQELAAMDAALDALAAAGSAAMPGGTGAASTISFQELIQLPHAMLDDLEQRAAQGSGTAAADLAGMMVVHVDDAHAEAVATALWHSPLVEFVYWQELAPPPPGGACTDLPPVTPSYASLQGYHGVNPGLNIKGVWSVPGARGQGVRIADCEYWFHTGHEDLCNVTAEAGQTPSAFIVINGWHHHGTAVLGELAASNNSYGHTGMVPEAQVFFFPEHTVEQGSRRATAVANAIATVLPGDVVLLEMQTIGAGGDYVPAEYDLALWLITKTGTDGGVVVVAAAGNGNQNLDGSLYASYMNRGDSGAIIVGAGSPDTAHDKMWFSTYGSRVNVHAWGTDVHTLGYGDLAQLGGSENQSYTSTFGGTSSASPMVAAAAAAVQGVARAHLGYPLKPKQLRDLLIATGIPQGSGGHIGPIPNIKAAVNVVRTVMRGDLNADGAVNGADLGLLLAAWGTCPACPADLTGDGLVDGADLGLLLANWD